MMLRIDDFPEPLLPISRTFFFFGFLTSLFSGAASMSAMVSVFCLRFTSCEVVDGVQDSGAAQCIIPQFDTVPAMSSDSSRKAPIHNRIVTSGS